MIAICDSGASKGDWALVSGDQVNYLESGGFNPYTHDHKVYLDELNHLFNSEQKQSTNKVYFYGSGCGETSQRERVKILLNTVFPQADVVVDTDLLAAAKSTCGDDTGIAVILGTGSNSGLYDGKQFTDSVANLGYLLGDEGSGNYCGKLLIRSYFFRAMPEHLRSSFAAFAGNHEDIMRKLYSKDEAVNKYLAGFMRFAMEHKEDPFIQRLIAKNFQDLIDANISKYHGYKDVPVHFVGSVGYYYQSILKDCLGRNGIQCGKIIAKPLINLVSYHQRHS
jgi:N-acetylglucosamine kinase-like BadF-type ATPase